VHPARVGQLKKEDAKRRPEVFARKADNEAESA
jgi:hypothetical protein